MRAPLFCVLTTLALAGCDRQQYDYVVGYQDAAFVSVDQGAGACS